MRELERYLFLDWLMVNGAPTKEEKMEYKLLEARILEWRVPSYTE
jgi:hypothetical protein